MNNSASDNFKSDVISLCGALLASGKIQLSGYIKLPNGKTEFHLSPKPICEELYNLYLNDKLILSASAIARKVAELNVIRKGNY
ncbi:hypothetical protein HYW46_03060 [Candidatus Daviesbacteria bacterium]|nr:hypothetical protein [Candidatus Daviesbacteria bacterium]